MSDKYLMDGHKLLWHLDRVVDWQQGKRIVPIYIDVGLSKWCNIKCHYCFGALQGNENRKGEGVYFPREPLLRYVREAGEAGVRSMAFIGEGEPTMNPHIYEAIVVGKKAGLDLAVGTNGILFDDGRDGEMALENLTWIRFNISAASDEAYRRLHASKEFDTFVRKVKFCLETKRRKNLEVTIGLQMVLTPMDVDQVIPLAKLGRDLGVDYLVIKQCGDTVGNELGVFNRLKEYDNYVDILKEAESISNKDYDVVIKWGKIVNRGKRTYERCLGAPFLLYSSGDGKLYPCGMFFNVQEEEYRMGDLVTQSFKEILQSDRYWQVIEKVKQIDVRGCYANCKTHAINEFLWSLERRKPPHTNFV